MADMKNELMALAGMTGEVGFKLGKVYSTPRLRVWMANEEFHHTILYNSFKELVKISVQYPRFPTNGGGSYLETKEIEVPFPIFISMFFTLENYEPVAEILSVNIEDSFDLCGNNPRHFEDWYNIFNRRSFSVGDVVEVVEQMESKFFVCCPIGWTEINRKIKVDQSIQYVFKTINPIELRS